MSLSFAGASLQQLFLRKLLPREHPSLLEPRTPFSLVITPLVEGTLTGYLKMRFSW